MPQPVYKYLIEIDGVQTQVYPRWERVSLQVTPEPDQMFFREKLQGDFIFHRADYDLINNESLETEFTFIIQELISGAYTDFWRGYFTKTDCTFEVDKKTIRVTPKTRDRYENIINALDREFDIIQLGVETTPVTITRQPLIQIYIPGESFLTNFIGGTYWEQPVSSPEINQTVLGVDYHFTPIGVFHFIPGSGNLTPDVSGSYTETTTDVYLRSDSAYRIVLEYDAGEDDDFWVIKVGAAGVSNVYKATTSQGTPFSVTFQSLSDPESTCKVYREFPQARYLTNETTVNGTPTELIPESDLVPANPNYTRALGLDVGVVFPSDGNSISATPYGKFADDALHFAGRYFTKPTVSGRTVYPISRSEWQYYSLWFYYDDGVEALQESGGTTFVLNDAYKLSDVLSAILAEVDSNIDHLESNAYSFLHAATNSIRGTRKFPMITPKSNITVGDYDQPASIARIKLSEIFELLRYFYKAFWHVDTFNRLIIEHVSYYENGGAYDTQIIGTDLTALLEPKTAKNWGHRANTFSYEKQDMPERIRFKWMDEVSPPFRGYDIVIRSNYIEKGNIQENRIARFTSDIDYMLAQPSEITKEGFAFMDAINPGDNNLALPFVEIELPNGDRYKMQNGYASFVYAHTQYHKHAMPANLVTINEGDTTATTVNRTKIQDITYPSGSAFDAMKLIKTGLGTGRAKNIDINLSTRQADITLAHDTE